MCKTITSIIRQEWEATEAEAVTIYATEPTETEQAPVIMKYAAEIAETAAARRQTAGDPLAKYRDMTYLEFDEPRPICQRHELATA